MTWLDRSNLRRHAVRDACIVAAYPDQVDVAFRHFGKRPAHRTAAVGVVGDGIVVGICSGIAAHCLTMLFPSSSFGVQN